MRFFVSVMMGVVAGGLLGSVLGLLVELATHQSGWSLVVGSLGANAGGFWAAMRRAEGKTIWRESPRRA